MGEEALCCAARAERGAQRASGARSGACSGARSGARSGAERAARLLVILRAARARVEASTLAARLGACISRQVRAARGMAWQLSVACGAGVRAGRACVAAVLS